METLERILAEHPFFAHLELRHLQLLVGCTTNVRFPAGQFICREGQEANQFYLIRQGKAAVEVMTPQRGPITIQMIPAYRFNLFI